MKKRLLSALLALSMALALLVPAYAVNPNDTATEANVLELLSQYDADAYHIMNSSRGGMPFTIWFMGGSLISGIDTAVHETYHSYTFNQYGGGFYGERIYLGGGKYYDVDYSIVYNSGNFTRTEEMSKNIPSHLQTFRYNTYVAPGADADANTKGVFGLLNEFTAYGWGLETMNSLSQWLIDTKAGTDAWQQYVSSIGNNMTAYSEFKYWTLRYMLYIKSANPSLYQAILDNEAYCAAYRDGEEKFAAEIERSRRIINQSAQYLSSIGARVDWSDSGIYLSGRGLPLNEYNALMREMAAAEYIEMDSVLKHKDTTPSTPDVPDVPDTPPVLPSTGFYDVAEDAWFADAVVWAVDGGITYGAGGDKFAPERTCTEGEILAMLYRAAGEPYAPSSPVTVDSWYQDAANWAYNLGMIGIGFDQDAPCTRASTVMFLWQAFGRKSAPASGVFPDVPSGYVAAVNWAYANGIASGTGGGRFEPDKTCQRQEIVTFLYRAYAG